MTPAESIAADTWRRLGQADSLGARLGEETLTDLLILDMLPHGRTNGFRIHHPTRAQESVIGADLLLCIRYPGGSGRRLALQAKKLYPNTGRYDALAHRDASGATQIDKLDTFARRWGAVPAYLLYNHLDRLPAHTPHWYCCRAHDRTQLGCTLVPAWCIRHAIRVRGGRTFEAIHADEKVRPWRCVFDCERPIEQVDELSLLRPEPEISNGKVVFHRERPDWLRTDTDGFDSLLGIDGALSATELRGLLPGRGQAADRDPGGAELTYPRRVLAVDVGDLSDETERELE